VLRECSSDQHGFEPAVGELCEITLDENVEHRSSAPELADEQFSSQHLVRDVVDDPGDSLTMASFGSRDPGEVLPLMGGERVASGVVVGAVLDDQVDRLEGFAGLVGVGIEGDQPGQMGSDGLRAGQHDRSRAATGLNEALLGQRLQCRSHRHPGRGVGLAQFCFGRQLLAGRYLSRQNQIVENRVADLGLQQHALPDPSGVWFATVHDSPRSLRVPAAFGGSGASTPTVPSESTVRHNQSVISCPTKGTVYVSHR